MYSKTLHYSRISISRARPPFRSIDYKDRGNSSPGNVAIFLIFLLLGMLLLMAQFNLVAANILKNHGVHPVLLGKWAI